MYFGAQYYPEHWPEERWEVDAQMMREAGVNTVRMGEFAWSAIEPIEGRYDFGWLDRAIALFHRHGIGTILCTMSRTPPPWIFEKHPEILNTDKSGVKSTHGRRYTVGHAHRSFKQVAERIDRAVIEHFSGNEAIVGWQIDNEVGGGNDCFCDDCRRSFHRYLEEKYGSISALNAAWGVHFWSLTYNSFEEVPLPLERANPQLNLEYRRFLSGLNVDFAMWRYKLIRESDPGKWVTTNFQSFHAKHTDYFALQNAIDINGMNHYPFRSPELILDYYRGARGQVLVLEQFTRLSEVDSGPGWMRLWAWMAIAHGATGINFFRWRCCRWGQEQHKDGLLPHSGRANRRYDELRRMGGEIKAIAADIDKTAPQASVAIVLSYESRWALESGMLGPEFDGAREAVAFHNELIRRDITVDALDPREDLSRYRLVIAPRGFCVDARTSDNYRAFVESGGTLCLTAATGVVDEYNVSFDTPRPGPLSELAGVEVSDLSPLDAPVTICFRDGDKTLEGTILADELLVTDADVVATFDSGWRKGNPAVSLKSHDRGNVVYLAASFEGRSMKDFCDYLLTLASVEAGVGTADGVRIYRRSGQEIEMAFILNYTDAPQSVAFGEGWEDAFTGKSLSDFTVDAVDLRIVRKK